MGLADGSELLPPTPYKIEKPIVFYGSSITQGGCSSRPGTTYENFVSRALDLNYINLGFSGNAKAEDEISDYIKNLDMTAFVFDYDHNAPSYEHLEATHEKMFLNIRKANPDLPILIMSMPNYRLNELQAKRRDLIKRTYDNAVARGDKNVYFLDGPALMRLTGEDGSVDGCHPTDFGFYSMSCAIIEVFKKFL